MAEKRPLPEEQQTALRNGGKRPRSDRASPGPNGEAAAGPKLSIQEQIAAAKERAAAVRARLEANKAPAPAGVARSKIEDIKARVAAATARSTPQSAAPLAPTLSYQTPNADDGASRARGGLGIGLHPALMADTLLDGRSKSKSALGSKFPTTIANRNNDTSRPILAGSKSKNQLDISGPTLEELKKNPYFDVSISSAAPRSRRSRELVFNQKGKFVAQAQALRRQAHLEEMKRKIAASARKAGLDDDRSEQAFLVQAPPEVEWWDEGLLSTASYPDFEADPQEAESALKLDTSDSIITQYVQHPVLLPPPMEKNMSAPKPLPLTKAEQKKKRRQDRMEVHKEQQAKIRLGLEPPPPPKVKQSNLIRVLGEQAVKDPTAVEARVNREIAERRQTHVDANELRKLSTEQRHEKLEANQEADAARGIMCAVFRIDSLAYGKHRYRIDINAKQNALTGITILHPRINLVIVEGGEKSMAKYKRLMLNRIEWTEIGPNLAQDDGPGSARSNNREATDKAWLKAEDEDGQLKDMSTNRCVLLWEGEEKSRAFKKWGNRVCETDAEAREALSRAKMENMWTLAKNTA